jgi:hypothetical protein
VESISILAIRPKTPVFDQQDPPGRLIYFSDRKNYGTMTRSQPANTRQMMDIAQLRHTGICFGVAGSHLHNAPNGRYLYDLVRGAAARIPLDARTGTTPFYFRELK